MCVVVNRLPRPMQSSRRCCLRDGLGGCSLGRLTVTSGNLSLLVLLSGVNLFLSGGLTLEFAFHLLTAEGHTNHATHVLSLLVDLLHVLSWRKHLVLLHATHASLGRTHLLALSFAFLTTALVKRRVQL